MYNQWAEAEEGDRIEWVHKDTSQRYMGIRRKRESGDVILK